MLTGRSSHGVVEPSAVDLLATGLLLLLLIAGLLL
jgi:hypothetical protein